MADRITSMTDAQRARMAPFAQELIERALRTGPCTPAERAEVEDGIRRCYEFAGIPWHGRVVWVSSPLVGALAAPIASHLLGGRAVDGAVGDAVGDAVRGAVAGAVGGAVDDAVGRAVGRAVDGAVAGAVGGAVDGAVGGAVGDAVRGAVAGAVGGAVGRAVDDAVGDAVGRAVGRAVDGAVGRAVDDAVGRAVAGAVGGAVRGAVDDGVGNGWYRYLSPWWSYWFARSTFCITELGACPEMSPRIDAWRAASGAGWWWPHAEFCIVADRPSEPIHRERVGPDGWGSHRLHRADGPAVRWGDEWAVYAWHGVVVPAWVIEDPTIERIQAEANTEIRRCAIEAYGWDRYLDHLGVAPVSTEPDPGNPGHTLELYDLPAAAQPFNEPVRLLVMRNASLDRDGSRRSFAETVPASCRTAVDAAAWQFDTDPAIYRALERAT